MYPLFSCRANKQTRESVECTERGYIERLESIFMHTHTPIFFFKYNDVSKQTADLQKQIMATIVFPIVRTNWSLSLLFAVIVRRFCFRFYIVFPVFSLLDIRICLHAHTKPTPTSQSLAYIYYRQLWWKCFRRHAYYEAVYGYEWNATLLMWLLTITQNVFVFLSHVRLMCLIHILRNIILIQMIRHTSIFLYISIIMQMDYTVMWMPMRKHASALYNTTGWIAPHNTSDVEKLIRRNEAKQIKYAMGLCEKSYFEIWNAMARNLVFLPDKWREIKNTDSIVGNSLIRRWHLIKILFSSCGLLMNRINREKKKRVILCYNVNTTTLVTWTIDKQKWKEKKRRKKGKTKQSW